MPFNTLVHDWITNLRDSTLAWWYSLRQFLRTWRQPYPRLIFIETEVVPSPSANNAHVGIAQYNVVGFFATISSSSTTVTTGWLLHIASQMTGAALVAGRGQFYERIVSFAILGSLWVYIPGSLLPSDHVSWECGGISIQWFDDVVWVIELD
jgi:hypothetical protein